MELPQHFSQLESILSNTSTFHERGFDSLPRMKKAERGYIEGRLLVVDFAIQCGISSLSNGESCQAFALFECAAQALKTGFDLGAIRSASDLIWTVFTALSYAQARHPDDIVKLFLKQLGTLTIVYGGSAHPLAIMVKHLLAAGFDMQVASMIQNIANQAVFSDSGLSQGFRLEEHEMNYHSVSSKLEISGGSYSLQQAEFDYAKTVAHLPSRYTIQFFSLGMARLHLEHGKFVEAANLLSDAPDELVEWIERGYRAGITGTPGELRTAPISMMAISWRLSALAQAFAGQGKHGAADANVPASYIRSTAMFPARSPDADPGTTRILMLSCQSGQKSGSQRD